MIVILRAPPASAAAHAVFEVPPTAEDDGVFSVKLDARRGGTETGTRQNQY